jgi:hypothetical protein
MPPLQLHAHGRRFGAPTDERVSGSPLEPTERVAHETWWLQGHGGEVGALLVGDLLHLAVGRHGTGWRRVDGAWQPLVFDQPRPPVLSAPAEPSLEAEERRRPLATLRWCSVTPTAGDPLLLVSGFDLGPGPLGPLADEELLAAIPEAPPPGFFARLLGAKEQEGTAMTLRYEAGDAPPPGWLPWLGFHRDHDLEFHCWGTEGGGELELVSAQAPVVPLREALLDLLRSHERLDPDTLADLYGNWQESGDQPDPSLTELVAGAPERGSWREVPLEELAGVLMAYASHTDSQGLRRERTLPGSALTARLRETVHEPLVLALYAEPTSESVVVWFVAGGVSKTSGQLECLLTERVWT